MKATGNGSLDDCKKAPIATWSGAVALMCLLGLAGCQGTVETYGYVPTGGKQSGSAAEANAVCLGRASAAKRAAAADIWAQGGEPAYHQTYHACMAEHGWKRTVTSSYRYG